VAVKDRVKEIREVRAGDLLVNPDNFRAHPPVQRSALEGLLAEVGNVDVLKAVETPKGLMLLDGHLRQDLLRDDVVKVAVLDLTEAEAKKVLLTFDRVTTLAELDPAILGGLMDAVAFEDAQVGAMLETGRSEDRRPLQDARRRAGIRRAARPGDYRADARIVVPRGRGRYLPG
jgi:hypothetical protein